MSSQVTVTVDGADRSVERGTRIRDVLLDGPRKIRDIVAAKLDGKVVDLSIPLEADASIEPIPDLSRQRRTASRVLPGIRPRISCAMAVRGGSIPVPKVAIDFRSSRTRFFMTTSRRKSPFYLVDDLPKIEAKMKEFAKADLRVYRTMMPKAEAIEKFRAMGEKYKVEIIEGIPEDPVSIYSQGEVDGSLSRTARSFDRLHQGIQADQRGGCVLARRRTQRHAQPHLRHLVPEQGRARRAPEDGGTGQAAGPSQAWAGDGLVFLRCDLPGQSFFTPARCDDL